MSSILTNTGAMVALQTMRSINSSMATTQNEISTGKSVSSARDNAAVWAVSKTMESDVQGFKSISDSLALGRSSVGVARNAAETVTDLLTQMQGRIVAAQEDNVDRGKIQNDVDALRKQISSVVGAAQFNGLNLVNGSNTDPVQVLSSLDRASDGTVVSSTISVNAQNLTQDAAVIDTTAGYAAGSAALGAASQTVDNTNATRSFTIAGIEAGRAFSLNLNFSADLTGGPAETAGGSQANAVDIAYVAAAGDTAADVAQGLVNAFNAWAAENDAYDLELSVNATGQLVAGRTGLTAGQTVAVAIDTVTSDENRAAGGLFAMAGMDVSTQEGAARALKDIQGLIQTAINSAAAFGSVQMRIDTQSEFVKNLSDALTTGIGALVDADMEATSARLQALQVQQQLAIQSLSIANQQPQNILALFR